MKTFFPITRSNQAGSALALTLIMTGIALAILASAMVWSVNSTRLTHRSIQYNKSILAAEAATEKILSRMGRDFLNGGDITVTANLPTYRGMYPLGSDSPYWNSWTFNDLTQNGRTFVQAGASNNFVGLSTAFPTLRGYSRTFTVVSHARDTAFPQQVIGGVLQEVQLAHVPIFQFAMYSSGDMEISCGQPLTITGRVHANGKLYVEPDNVLTFQSDATAVTDILYQRHPEDPRGTNIGGSYVFKVDPVTPVSAATLPIGTTNSPEAVREIIQPPLAGGDTNSQLAALRYYNQADMIITVSNSGVSATSGKSDNFSTSVPTNELAGIVTTNNNFKDWREDKTVRPLDINVALLAEWSRTNTNVKSISSVYVLDRRTLAGTDLAAVRLRNGTNLPARGLTVATARPLYVLGNYNQTNSANLGSTNTITTRPASLVADAVTILSESWSDANSTKTSTSDRTASATTVNAAILTGVVETTKSGYSGGMENFARFLEKWGAGNVLTYNGSMIKMFPSLYATNVWGKANVYDPPKRNWAFDLNFNDPAKLPPLTPSLLWVVRGQWATVASDKNTASTYP